MKAPRVLCEGTKGRHLAPMVAQNRRIRENTSNGSGKASAADLLVVSSWVQLDGLDAEASSPAGPIAWTSSTEMEDEGPATSSRRRDSQGDCGAGDEVTEEEEEGELADAALVGDEEEAEAQEGEIPPPRLGDPAGEEAADLVLVLVQVKLGGSVLSSEGSIPSCCCCCCRRPSFPPFSPSVSCCRAVIGPALPSFSQSPHRLSPTSTWSGVNLGRFEGDDVIWVSWWEASWCSRKAMRWRSDSLSLIQLDFSCLKAARSSFCESNSRRRRSREFCADSRFFSSLEGEGERGKKK